VIAPVRPRSVGLVDIVYDIIDLITFLVEEIVILQIVAVLVLLLFRCLYPFQEDLVLVS